MPFFPRVFCAVVVVTLFTSFSSLYTQNYGSTGLRVESWPGPKSSKNASSPQVFATGFSHSSGLGLSPDHQFIYVTDRNTGNVYKIPTSYSSLPFVVTDHPESAIVKGLSRPTDVSISSNGEILFIADAGTSTIYAYSTLSQAKTTAIINLPEDTAGYYVTLSHNATQLLVCSTENNAVYSINLNQELPIDASLIDPFVIYTGSNSYNLTKPIFSPDGSTIFISAFADGKVYNVPFEPTQLFDINSITPVITHLDTAEGGPCYLQLSSDGGSTLEICMHHKNTVYLVPTISFPYRISNKTPSISGFTGDGVYASTTLPPAAPPTHCKGSLQMNSFPLCKQYVNKLEWQKSVTPNVSAYEIYRNDALIATTSELYYQDREGSFNSSYKIRAITPQGSSSPFVSVQLTH